MTEDDETYEASEEVWQEDETSLVPLDEHPSFLAQALSHPRLTLGGGSLLLSFAVDIAIRFDGAVVVLGLATALAIGWNGESLARGMQLLIPGWDQQQVREDADHFADQVLGDYPIHPDQRPIAKIRRLWRSELNEEVAAPLPPKRERAHHHQRKDECIFTFEGIVTCLEKGLITDQQFFFLLKRMNNPRQPVTRNARSVGAQPASEAGVSPENEDVTPVPLPPGWAAANAALIPGLYRVFGNLDKCLEAIDVSTHPRNRDFAREILKQQGFWREK